MHRHPPIRTAFEEQNVRIMKKIMDAGIHGPLCATWCEIFSKAHQLAPSGAWIPEWTIVIRKRHKNIAGEFCLMLIIFGIKKFEFKKINHLRKQKFNFSRFAVGLFLWKLNQ